MTAAELERSVVNLAATLASLMTDLERSRMRLLLLKAALSQHQHDWTRDVTGKPTTFTPATHTHAYASSTHVHDYLDSQLGLLDSDIAGSTGFPREP